MSASLRVVAAIALLSGLPVGAAAQAVRGTIVDQTGLPLPGAIHFCATKSVTGVRPMLSN